MCHRDESVVERALGIDPLHEGVVAVCGCGRPAATSPLDPSFQQVKGPEGPSTT